MILINIFLEPYASPICLQGTKTWGIFANVNRKEDKNNKLGGRPQLITF